MHNEVEEKDYKPHTKGTRWGKQVFISRYKPCLQRHYKASLQSSLSSPAASSPNCRDTPLKGENPQNGLLKTAASRPLRPSSASVDSTPNALYPLVIRIGLTCHSAQRSRRRKAKALLWRTSGFHSNGLLSVPAASSRDSIIGRGYEKLVTMTWFARRSAWPRQVKVVARSECFVLSSRSLGKEGCQWHYCQVSQPHDLAQRSKGNALQPRNALWQALTRDKLDG